MKHAIVFWSLSLCLLFSCNKKKVPAPNTADIMYSNMKDTTVNRDQQMFFDIDKNGKWDLILRGEIRVEFFGLGSKSFEVSSSADNAVSYGYTTGGQVYLLQEGSAVFSGMHWINNMILKQVSTPSGKEDGFWTAGHMKGYLGLRLPTKLGLCYGWARVSLSDSGAVTLHEYALNKKVDQPIAAGQRE